MKEAESAGLSRRHSARAHAEVVAISEDTKKSRQSLKDYLIDMSAPAIAALVMWLAVSDAFNR